jgi:GH15 family glucan-1,4-alpha-glucosidase
MYRDIKDYAIIGNSQTAALISNTGSIDWLCLPSLDSPSVFAALLDAAQGGFFEITALDTWDSSAAYLPETNILTTHFRTPTGQMTLTDFMSLGADGPPPQEIEQQRIYRHIEVNTGKVEVRVRFAPRFDYARTSTTLALEDTGVVARSNCGQLHLLSEKYGFTLHQGVAEARWRLHAGEQIWLCLHFGSDHKTSLMPGGAETELRQTQAYWRDWLTARETGMDLDFGPFSAMVVRSSLVLKLLDYAPTGALAAAATTSLPEQIGGERNWDYRFCWLRDAALTVEALYRTGHLAEMENYLHWLETIVCRQSGELQVLYGLRGETDLAEQELSHLAGYKGSRPVRIGNGAAGQRQLDVYGEVMDAALRLSNYVGKISLDLWPFLRSICETAANSWEQKDSGIWEVRNGPWHFVYSKVMCWVALDRGITIAQRYGFPADLQRWGAIRENIRTDVLTRGWSESRQAFVQHYETDAVDASSLLLPFYDFLPYDDPRMVSTVAAIEKELANNGFVWRYLADDGVAGEEGAFLLCSFWLVDNLIGQGRLDEAQTLLLRLEQTASPLGLFAEEYDPSRREALGNYPQAFSHIGYLNSVFALCRARQDQKKSRAEKTHGLSFPQKIQVNHHFILNQTTARVTPHQTDIATELKRLMNLLRGAFFNTAEGRIAYEQMADSSLYQQYRECTRLLQGFDLATLKDREEQLAFWINMFNVLVIHGVIDLGIAASVKEVPRFFRRIAYNIGGCEFSADDIEHGILRKNHRYPHSLLHPFAADDPRRRFVIEPIDPRIHFALVCASVSCPPIEIYRAETLEEDLRISGQTFLNAGGIQIDRDQKGVKLSKVFQWYGGDFGKTEEERLRFVAPYLYEKQDREFLLAEAGRLKVDYLDYDWRLNRG